MIRRFAAITLATIVLAALFPQPGSTLPSKEPRITTMSDAVDESVEITGILNVYGSEPHTYIALLVMAGENFVVTSDEACTVVVDADTLFRLESDGPNDLRMHQGQSVIVVGRLVQAPRAPALPGLIEVTSFRAED